MAYTNEPDELQSLAKLTRDVERQSPVVDYIEKQTKEHPYFSAAKT